MLVSADSALSRESLIESHCYDSVMYVQNAHARDGHLDSTTSSDFGVQVFDDSFDCDTSSVLADACQDADMKLDYPISVKLHLMRCIWPLTPLLLYGLI